MSSTPAPLALTLDVSAVPAQPAGAGRYTIELARAMAARRDLGLTVVTRRKDVARWEDLAARAGPEGHMAVAALVPGPRPARLVFEQLRLGRALVELGPEVHHGPHYTMPARSPVPVVVTIHDVTFFEHPEWHERTKAAFFRHAIARAAKEAAALVCVSAFTAGRLQEVCEVRAPVFVVPHGVDHDRFGPSEPAPGHDQAQLSALGLDARDPLVVFVGTREPRKGVVDLVEAFDRVAETHKSARLVLAGQPGWSDERAERALAGARHGDRVVEVGYVPDGALPALLRGAAVVAYPSLEEGYGLPALEALACGAPLVTTSGTVMEETAGGAALLVPPGDPGALADALGAVLEGSVDRAAMHQRGLAVAAARTWEASAGGHLGAYRAAREQ